MAIVYAKDNIRANIIHPGPVDTPMQKEWDEKTKMEINRFYETLEESNFRDFNS